MGTWGPGFFENDTASDWRWEIDSWPGLVLVDQSLNGVWEPGEDLEDNDSMDFEPVEDRVADFDYDVIIAAADTIAALRGHPSKSSCCDSQWISDRLQEDTEPLTELAIGQVERILADREYREGFAEPCGTQWETNVRELLDRLKRPAVDREKLALMHSSTSNRCLGLLFLVVATAAMIVQ